MATHYGSEPPDGGAGWTGSGTGRWERAGPPGPEDSRGADLKSKSVLVADHGLFVELAPRLAREFGEVKLWVPWMSSYPRAAPAFVGTGLPGVERVETFWDHVADADLVVFPDLYMADMAAVCRDRLGKPVWSHFGAENLELDRRGTRRLQRRLGIGAPPTRHFSGLDSLAAYLEDPANEDKWVKISCYRGDGETWRHDTWHTTSIRLDEFRNRVGALADTYEFLVEDNVEGVEVGYDGWTVRGAFPSAAYWGFEVKDKGYIGRFSNYADMPKSVRDVNERVSLVLREEGAVGFCSFESRLTKRGGAVEALMIDPCLRCGSPPIEATMEGYDNLGEIVWEGAHGRVAEPRSAGEFLAIAMVHSSFALTNWVPIEVPPGEERWLKLRNKAIISGKVYHVPTHGSMPEIGAVVAVADSLDEAKRLVAERAEQVHGYLVEVHVGALDAAEEEIEEAREYGVEWE